MCKCTPAIRTPYCGKGQCVWPGSKPEGARSSAPQDLEEFIAAHQDRVDNECGESADVIYPNDLRSWMNDHVRVQVELIENTLDAVREELSKAHNEAYPVCCGRSGKECCGSPEPEWPPHAMATMEVLGPIEKELSSMLNASKGESSPDLWCVHILGPDDLHAAPSRAYAEVAADLHNRRFADLSAKLDVVCKAVAAPWPYSRESHAEDVASFIDDWFMPEPIVSRVNASKGE